MPIFHFGFHRRWSIASLAMLNLYACKLMLICCDVGDLAGGAEYTEECGAPHRKLERLL
jgi:hypothetical protein